MPLRARLARTVVALLIVCTALVSVGLTAPADGPFSIGVHTVFLGLELEIKLGSLRLEYKWSAIPPIAATTKSTGNLL